MTENINLRFMVVTDGHWGSITEVGGESTDNEQAHYDALSRIDSIHQEQNIDFLVANGDIVHDDEALHQEVIDNFFSDLPTGVDWYPAMGNHDWATDSEWQSIYGHEKQQSFSYGDYGFLITDTGDARSTNWVCADANWVESELDAFDSSGINDVFVFNHTPPSDSWDAYGADCPAVRSQFGRDIVRAVFLGHNHNKNTVENHSGTQYVFSCRIGGVTLGSSSNDVDDLGVRVVDIYD